LNNAHHQTDITRDYGSRDIFIVGYGIHALKAIWNHVRKRKKEGNAAIYSQFQQIAGYCTVHICSAAARVAIDVEKTGRLGTEYN